MNKDEGFKGFYELALFLSFFILYAVTSIIKNQTFLFM